LVVRLNTNKRKELRRHSKLTHPYTTRNSNTIVSISKCSIKNGPNQIQREDAKRRIVVGFNVRGRDVQSIVNELQQKVDKQIKFPSGYYVTYGGAFENLNASQTTIDDCSSSFI
jgi:cobalt-zinc-cadmium resistance protein CzcA